ncbi:MAG: extracellular solute-binding protein, partial [Chloroflexales bacterium]|nr:extracellular solute-binding protein [Chloroflexales bacterium]
DAIAATLDQAADWAHNGIIYTPLTTPEPGAPDQTSQAVRQGQIALWPYAMTHDVDNLAFAIALLPRPALPHPLRIDNSDALVISRGSQQPPAAWRWLAFLSRQPLAAVVTNPRVAPARRSLMTHSALWDHRDAEARQVVLNALAQPAPSRASLDQAALTALRAAWHAALQGAASDAALRAAQTALDAARAQHAAASPQTTVPPFVVAAPPSRTAPADATTISFGAFADHPTVIRQLITAFQADNPDIVVDLKDSYAANLSGDEAALAETFDCFTTSGFPVSTTVTATLDLQPLLDADSSIDADDIPQQLRAPYRHGNAVHGLPYLVKLQTLSYNPRVFAAAGLSIPAVTWTRADVLAAAEALTRQEDAAPQYGYADSATQLVNMVFFLKLFGAELARVTAAGVEPALNDPSVQAIAADYVTLLRRASPHEQIMGYGPPIPEQEVLGTLIEDGRVAMWLNLGNVGWGPESRHPDVAVAPLPLGEYDAGVQIIEPVSSFYIAARTPQQQACWRLFRAISSALEIVRLPGMGGQTIFPARRSVVEAMAANAQTLSRAHDVYLTYLDVLEHTPLQRDASPRLPPMYEWWLAQAIDQALQGDGDVAQALDQAQHKAVVYTDCVRSGNDNAVCVQQADPSW